MLLLTVLLTLATQGSPADKAIDAAIANYSHVHTARATFDQAITNPLTGRTIASKGEFLQERPDKFAFRFTDPKNDVIVADGKYVWLYLPSTEPGQVIRSSLASGPAGALDLIGEFFTNPRARYAIGDGGAATVGDKNVHIVTLAPKAKDAAFVRAKVWIDPSDGSLLQFEAEEPSGVTRLVHITSFTPNATVPAGVFVFKVPRGVKVVDGTTLTTPR